MSNRVEIACQVDIDDDIHPSEQAAPHFRKRLVGRAVWSKSVGVRAEIRLEDALEDELQGSLHRAIADAWNLKHADFALVLGDFDSPVRPGLVGTREQVCSDGLKGSRSITGINRSHQRNTFHV